MADISETEASAVTIENGDGGTKMVVNSDGSINNALIDGIKSTYSAVATAFVAAATPTDVFTITGSATKTIRIRYIEFTATTTTAGGIAVSTILVKRSAANTAGTFVADTKVPHDSSNAAATVTVGHYTANPTVLGAAVGNIRADRYAAQSAGTPAVPLVWSFGNEAEQPIVLRGVSEILAINLNSTTITGSVINISVCWTEE